MIETQSFEIIKHLKLQLLFRAFLTAENAKSVPEGVLNWLKFPQQVLMTLTSQGLWFLQNR